MNSMDTYDYVIVGAGSAGCVLANRLSADATNRVLLLEAGRSRGGLKTRIPAAFPQTFRTRVDWAYTTTPQLHCANRTIFLPRGRLLGGSSSINAMIYQRCANSDWDKWKCSQWTADAMAPYFDRAEGPDGLSVEPARSVNSLTRAFVETCAVDGFEEKNLIGPDDPYGVAITHVTQRSGERCSAAKAYIEPAAMRPNLTIRTETGVARITLETGRATGVELLDGESVRADREVIVCGGAFNSPQLLMLSGIGPANHLRDRGINVVHDSPGVGANYQEHMLAGLRFRCNRPVSMARAGSIPDLMRFLFFGQGPLTSNLAEAYAFYKSDPRLHGPDIEFAVCPAIFDTDKSHKEHGFSIATVLLKPKSTGTVRLADANPQSPPVIDGNFLAEPEDVTTIVEGMKRALRIASTGPLVEFNAGVMPWGTGPSADEDLEGYMRGSVETIFHPAGTCKLGPDEEAVVDEALRVRGIEGLRVVDASVMPAVPSGHPQGVITAIAERAADLVLNA